MCNAEEASCLNWVAHETMNEGGVGLSVCRQPEIIIPIDGAIVTGVHE